MYLEQQSLSAVIICSEVFYFKNLLGLFQVAQNRLPFRLAARSFKPSTLQGNPTFIKFKANSDRE